MFAGAVAYSFTRAWARPRLHTRSTICPGPRFCPGRNLAFLESKSAMAMIARNFEIELDDSEGPVTEQFSFTMVPRGLRVRLRRRAARTPNEFSHSHTYPRSESESENPCPVRT
jgi:Cytochrome P450